MLSLDLPPLLTPLLLAQLFNWALFGILTVQVYIYYVAFPRDKYKFKVVVGLAYMLEIVQVVLSTHDVVRQLAAGWGNLSMLIPIGFYWFSIPILSGILSSMCQFVYAWRIFMFSHAYWIAGIICLMSATQMAFAVYDGVKSQEYGILLDIPKSGIFESSLEWTVANILCDAIITCSMLYYLWRAKQSTTIRPTASLITRIIRLTIETGLAVTVTSIVSFVTFMGFPETGLYAIPQFVLSKVYTNCLLAVLNSRLRIVGGRDDAESIGMLETSLTDTSSSGPISFSPRPHRHNLGDIVIDISRDADTQSLHDKEDSRLEYLPWLISIYLFLNVYQLITPLRPDVGLYQ